jgi:hypothetical protein
MPVSGIIEPLQRDLIFTDPAAQREALRDIIRCAEGFKPWLQLATINQPRQFSDCLELVTARFRRIKKRHDRSTGSHNCAIGLTEYLYRFICDLRPHDIVQARGRYGRGLRRIAFVHHLRVFASIASLARQTAGASVVFDLELCSSSQNIGLMLTKSHVNLNYCISQMLVCRSQ